MKINKKNYEAYFLDYRENNLDPGQVAELLIFLEENTDLKDEFESYEKIQLTPEQNIKFEQKESLKKKVLIPTDHINSSNYEEFMVADLEGDLSEHERAELKAFTELNPEMKLEYNIFRTTFLEPERTIQFEHREKLKKTGLFVLYRKPVYYSVSVAASIILLLGIYFGFVYHPKETNPKVAVETPDIPTSIPQPKPTGTVNIKLVADQNEQPDSSVRAHIAVAHPDNDRFSRMAGNFRMNNLPVLTEIHVKDFAFALPGIRENESLTDSFIIEVPGTEKQKSFVNRFVTGLAGKLIHVEKPIRKSFLEYTIEGYNLMADKNVSLEKKVDETGKVIAYTLDGENLSLFRNRSQQKQ